SSFAAILRLGTGSGRKYGNANASVRSDVGSPRRQVPRGRTSIFGWRFSARSSRAPAGLASIRRCFHGSVRRRLAARILLGRSQDCLGLATVTTDELAQSLSFNSALAY